MLRLKSYFSYRSVLSRRVVLFLICLVSLVAPGISQMPLEQLEFNPKDTLYAGGDSIGVILVVDTLTGEYGHGVLKKYQVISISGDTLFLENGGFVDMGAHYDNIYTIDGTILANRNITQGALDINFDANTLVIDGSADRVGIGTTAPDQKLDVRGNIHVRGGSPQLSFEPTANTHVSRWVMHQLNTTDSRSGLYIYGSAASLPDAIQFRNAGNLTRMMIENTGNVGIGTTTPDAKLDIEGGNVRLSDYGSQSITGTHTNMIGVESDGDIIEISNNADTITKVWASVSGGAPFWKVDATINPDSVATDGYIEAVAITNDSLVFTGTDQAFTGKLDLSLYLDNTNIYANDGTLSGNRAVTQGSYDLNFDANTLVIYGSEDRVGIGTTAPDQKLDVRGNIHVRGGSPQLSFEPTANTHVSRWVMHQLGTTDARSGLYIFGSAASLPDAIQFRNAGNLTRMMIENTGNVGIGTTTPDAKLDVEGGGVRFSDYGDGTKTGTETYLLAVDSDGDIIETEPLDSISELVNDLAFISNSSDTSIYKFNGTIPENTQRVITMGNSSSSLKIDGTSVNDIYFTNDALLGIGTSTPSDFVHLSNPGSGAYNAVRTENLNGYARFGTISGFLRMDVGATEALYGRAIADEGWIGVNVVPAGVFHVQTSEGVNSIVVENTTGDVGIGTTTPDVRFDVEGGTVKFSEYGAGTYDGGTETYLLGVDADGDVVEKELILNLSQLNNDLGLNALDTSIYKFNGTLTGDRRITQNGKTFEIWQDANNSVMFNEFGDIEATGDFHTGASEFDKISIGGRFITFDGSDSDNVTLKNIANQSPVLLQTTGPFGGLQTIWTAGAGTVRTFDITAQTILSAYGTGTQAGTETYNLSVDATGVVIETEPLDSLSELVNDVGFVTTSDDADSDPTNEFQSIGLQNTDQITLSDDASFVDMGTLASNLGWDTNAANDLTTGTTFSGDVSGLYNNLQLGTGVVGANELSSLITPGSCTNCNITYDTDGRITIAANGSGGSVQNLTTPTFNLTTGVLSTFIDGGGSGTTIDLDGRYLYDDWVAYGSPFGGTLADDDEILFQNTSTGGVVDNLTLEDLATYLAPSMGSLSGLTHTVTNSTTTINFTSSLSSGSSITPSTSTERLTVNDTKNYIINFSGTITSDNTVARTFTVTVRENGSTNRKTVSFSKLSGSATVTPISLTLALPLSASDYIEVRVSGTGTGSPGTLTSFDVNMTAH